MLYSYIPQPTNRTNIAPVLPRSAFRAHAKLMKVAIEENDDGEAEGCHEVVQRLQNLE